MSETQHYKGTLSKVSHDNEPIEDAIERVLTLRGIKKEDYYDSWEEFIEGEYYKEFVIIDGSLYWAVKESIDPCDSFFIGRKTDDPNTIEFDVMYHNGGCSFDEAMIEALKDANSVDVQIAIKKSGFAEKL